MTLCDLQVILGSANCFSVQYFKAQFMSLSLSYLNWVTVQDHSLSPETKLEGLKWAIGDSVVERSSLYLQ